MGVIESSVKTIDGYDVVGSGSASLPAGSERLQIGLADLTFEFQFVKQDGDQSSVSASNEGKTLRMQLINWANVLGTSFTSQVGHIGGKKLHLSIYVTAIVAENGVSRLLTYTFWLGDAR